MFAGSTGSLSVLGAPDLIVLTLTEFAEQAYRICRAGNLALLVDSDHGYGNALNVKRTVEELETAGVAALTIEDTLLPRPYGPSDKATLIPIEEGVGKMKAALAFPANNAADNPVMARSGFRRMVLTPRVLRNALPAVLKARCMPHCKNIMETAY